MNWPTQLDAIVRKMPRGTRVFLRKSTWFDHICANHPELESCLADVLNTLTHPESIYQCRNERYSFRYSQKRGSFIMLVYKISGTVGYVKTAYTLPNPYVEVEGLNRVWPI